MAATLGQDAALPEVDRGQWFALPEAKTCINPGQVAFLEELALLLEARP